MKSSCRNRKIKILLITSDSVTSDAFPTSSASFVLLFTDELTVKFVWRFFSILQLLTSLGCPSMSEASVKQISDVLCATERNWDWISSEAILLLISRDSASTPCPCLCSYVEAKDGVRCFTLLLDRFDLCLLLPSLEAACGLRTSEDFGALWLSTVSILNPVSGLDAVRWKVVRKFLDVSRSSFLSKIPENFCLFWNFIPFSLLFESLNWKYIKLF